MFRLTFAVLMVLASLTPFSVMAQTYSIRVDSNTNLRAEASLDSDVVQSAPAGSVLQVVGSFGRWLNINRDGLELWMADWVSYSRVDGGGHAVPQPVSSAPAGVDNCCQVDRECHTAADWTNGYWAFQNGQCAAPTQPQPQSPAQPASSIPAGVDNCCQVDRQCQTEADWTNGYYAYQNNQCAAPAPAQPQTSAPPVSSIPAGVDNCCQVDRQCQTEADWTNGYYAYQNNQCAAPAPAQPQTSAPPVSSIPAGVDNCCQVDRECHTEADWTNGYYAYQNGQCGGSAQPQSPAQPAGGIPAGIDNCCRAGWHCESDLDWQRGWSAYQLFQCSDDIPMRIDGSATFVNLVREAYNRLKRTSPHLYIYGITGFSSIREDPADGATGYFDQSNTFVQAFGRSSYTEYDVVTVVGGIAHEACHAHKLADGTATSGWRNELPCMQKELESYHAVDPTDRHGYIAWAQDIVDNIQNPDYWWWD